MKMVKHTNIVKLYEVLASRTKIFIVRPKNEERRRAFFPRALRRQSHRRRPPALPAAQVLELIAGGELFDKIVAESRFDEKTARFYFRQLIKGVKCEILRALFCRSGAAHLRRVRAPLRGSW